jgi:hypothetical protein
MFRNDQTRERTSFSSSLLAARIVFAFFILFFFPRESRRRAFDGIVDDLRRVYLTFHLIGDEGKKAAKFISMTEVGQEEIAVASAAYSGSIDDMAARLSISSPWDGNRLDFVDLGICRFDWQNRKMNRKMRRCAIPSCW